MGIEYKRSTIEIKDVSSSGRFEGWGAIIGTEDDGGDTIRAGAFKKSLRARTPKIYYQHDTSIGVYTVAEEREKGLWVEGQPDESRDGLDARAKLASGALDGLSIGYLTVKSKETGRFKRDLLEVNVFHVGLVPFGMHPDAVVTAVKALDLEGVTTVRDLERVLRDVGFSKKAAEVFCSKDYIAKLQRGEPVSDEAMVVDTLRRAMENFKT
jgi:HK97 family phage prohead protease